MKLALRFELLFTTFTALLTVANLAAQNLVPNSGFESYDRCPGSYTQDKAEFKIPGWYSAAAGPTTFMPAAGAKPAYPTTGRELPKPTRDKPMRASMPGPTTARAIANTCNAGSPHHS